VEYEFCDTPEAIVDAVMVLSQGSYVLLDCEGVSIGDVNGVLSILSLGTPLTTSDDYKQRIFLIDILAMKQFPADSPTYDALRDLLSSPDITKVVWDGRMDAIELLYTFSSSESKFDFTNVLDLQIAEVMGRTSVIGEEEAQRKERLAQRAGWKYMRKQPELFIGLHVMIGLGTYTEKYLPHVVASKDGAYIALIKSCSSCLCGCVFYGLL
jgi:exonuclease 3'-5' domain-containing protein 1